MKLEFVYHPTHPPVGSRHVSPTCCPTSLLPRVQFVPCMPRAPALTYHPSHLIALYTSQTVEDVLIKVYRRCIGILRRHGRDRADDRRALRSGPTGPWGMGQHADRPRPDTGRGDRSGCALPHGEERTPNFPSAPRRGVQTCMHGPPQQTGKASVLLCLCVPSCSMRVV